jgi:hypothetical protein
MSFTVTALSKSSPVSPSPTTADWGGVFLLGGAFFFGLVFSVVSVFFSSVFSSVASF